MSSKEKGKAVDTGGGGGKRKRCGKFDDDKSGGGKKKRNREVLQFFEDAADVDDYESDDSDFDFDLGVEDYMDEEYDVELKVKNEPPKFQNLPFVPKEEEIDEEEFDKMMEERFKNNPRFHHVEDADGTTMERNSILPSSKDPTVWKVKCTVGRERHSAFCLMQKFVDLKPLGTKLQIISAFAVDHIKGFVYVEADKEIDIIEACKGMSNIYSTRVAPVPKNEVSHLLSIQKSCNQVTEGMWARVKNGNYKGDLTQIVAVNNVRKRATVKLIPRIDFQALAQKFGGGVAIKKAAIPAPRLISSSELEEFRPLIQYRRDRDTGKMFEVLDGLMLKDGYLYKRVSIDSLSCWGVMPTEEELLKFKPSENNESDNLEWLTQIYGGPKKKRVVGNEKSGEKGESSSASGQNRYELYDLVCFGRKDFGLIVGMEKDDSYRILKHGPQEQQVVNLELRELKNGPSDMKFTALDRHSKPISINDTVKVLEGSLKDRQGIVKQIYRGVIFIYDHNETKDGGYFCSKAQLCEKIKLSFDACNEKGGESGCFGFEDFPSSPKSPLSPKRPWQAKENTRDFNQGEKDGMFSIGQTLRIRVGPLKGYLCQVLAVRYSDVTVKLGSKQKVLTVKSEHLSEVRGKSSAMPASDDQGSNSFKPFDLLGTEGGSGDWTGGAGTTREGHGWNTGGLAAERTSWPSFSSSGITPQTESNPVNPSSSADNELKKDAAWEGPATANHSSSWGATSADGWNKAVTNIGCSTGASDGWGKATLSSESLAGSSRGSGDNWGQEKVENSSIEAAAAWDKGKTVANQTSSWGDAATGKNQVDSWGISNDAVETGSWEKNKNSSRGEECWGNKNAGWNQQKLQGGGDSWGKAVEDQDKPTEGWGNADRTQPEEDADKASGWMKAKVDSASQTGAWGSGKKISEDATGWTKDGSSNQNQTDGWSKPKAFVAEGGSSWNNKGDSNWAKSEGGSSWNNKGDSTWDKSEGGSSWNRQDRDQEFGGGHQASEGGSSWNNKGDSTWGKSGGGSWNRQDRDQECGGWHRTSDRGRGSGVRGRGGGWGDQGRSIGECQSFGWKGGENNSSGNDRDQEFGGSNKTYDGGRGSGVRGRGGGRGARGKSFGEGQSFGWKGGENNSSDINQGGSWGKSKGFEESRESGWKSVSSGGDGGSGWSKNWGADKGTDGSGDKWNSGDISAGGQNEGGSWNVPKSADGNSSSGWNTKADDAYANQSSGWDTQLKKDSEHKDKSDGWNGGKASDEGSAKGWGQTAGWKGVGNDSGRPSDTERNQNSSWGNKSNWNSGSSDAGGNADYTLGQKSNWSSGTSDAGGNADSTWGKKSNWSSGSSDAGGNVDTTWDKKSNWSSGSGDADGNADLTWGKKSNWNSGSSDASQESGWGKKTSFGSGCSDGNLDSSVACDGNGQTETYGNRVGGGSWRGSFGGRGGSDRGRVRGRGDIGGFGGRNHADRGGYGGRGRSERGGFGGRGGSDRGGFRGRGGSDRGGFGSRGRGRRDQSGGWNDNSAKDKTFDWRNGTNNSSWGWKNDDGGTSWSRGGGDTSNWSSWNSESGGTSSRSGGGQSSGWNPCKEVKEGTTSGGPTDSWGKGSASYWGNKGDEGNAKGERGWNKGAGSSRDEAKPWNQSSSDGGQSSGWNQSTDTKEGTNAGGEPTDAWGKASAASSWGNKGNDGSSKGGW